MTQLEYARVFHALHQDGLLILPNAWDAGSARIIEEAGAKAIATSSAAVAWAHGYPDGEALPADTVIATVRETVRAVRIPVSADIEAGFAIDANGAGEFVTRVIDAGAVWTGVVGEARGGRAVRMRARARGVGGAMERRVHERVGVGVCVVGGRDGRPRAAGGAGAPAGPRPPATQEEGHTVVPRCPL